jgi:hypothetical protein
MVSGRPDAGDQREPARSAGEACARARIAVETLRRQPATATDLGPALADLVTSLNLTRPHGLSDADWDDLLDRAFWISRPPGGHCRARPPSTARRLTTAARTLATHGSMNRANWTAIATEIAGAIAALSRAHDLAQRRRQAEHAAQVDTQLKAAVTATGLPAQSRDLLTFSPPTPTTRMPRTRGALRR